MFMNTNMSNGTPNANNDDSNNNNSPSSAASGLQTARR